MRCAGFFLLGGVLVLTACVRSRSANCGNIADQLDQRFSLGDETGALTLADSGMRACSAASPDLYWRFYSRKAELLIDAGKYDQGLAVLLQDPPPGPQFASIRSNRRMDQAWVAYQHANYTSSHSLLDLAAAEARQSGPRSAALFTQIAIRRVFVYGSQRDFAAAEELVAKLRHSAAGVDKTYLFTTYGWLLIQADRFEEAAASFEETLPEVEASKKGPEMAQVYNNLGSIYYKLGDLERSLSYTLKAEAILHDASYPVSLQFALNTAGLNYLERGQFAKAESSLSEALELSKRMDEKRSKSEVLQNLAFAAIGAKSWDRAEERNRSALVLARELNDNAAQQSTHVSEARVLAGRGDYTGALASLSKLDHDPFFTGSPRIDAEREYITIYRQLGNEAQARAHYQTAVALSESVRAAMQKDENKLAWYSSQISLTQEWVRFLIKAQHTDEALEVVEASRARLMTERIGRTSSSARGTVAGYRLLARDATLVSYWLMPEVSYVWIVTPTSVEVRPLPGEDALEALVERYQSFLEARRDPLQADNHAGEDLRKALLDPILPLLAGAKNVILVPDGPLHALNFETLPVNGHYWIDDVTLTIAPSLNVLRSASPVSPNTARTALVVGDAAPTEAFPALPAAAREIETVSSLFPRSTVLRGADATPAAYLHAPPGAAYIHFAAHASASAERPLDSAVILTGDNGREGRLTAHDLLGKPLHAELVTISACRSAGVRSYHGEGPVGFAWVFLQTGAHGVIAGLWDASDNATADIMSGLYTRIAHGETPPAALRAAKLDLVHGPSHWNRPFYWAPFQYYGGAGR